MYLSTITRPRAAKGRGVAFVGGNVLALGTVSLITDVSAEMVTAVLPLYLVLGLHLSPLAYGVVDGVYTGATALLRIVGGYVADRVRARKTLAGFGYALSAVAKLGLLAAGRSLTGIGFVVAVDRMGKGLRTAPRDALITMSTPPSALGRAFGVHRTMDAVGAFLGPLVALAVLAGSGQSYDAVFVTSFLVAILGVAVLVLFVRERDPLAASPPASPTRVRDAVALLRSADLRRLLLAATLLGVATIGDGFVYLMLQRRTEIGLLWFPLLAVGTSLGYLLLAAPLGMLADRIGRRPVLLAGYAALAVTYLLLAAPIGGWALLVAALAAYGLYYAATDGVLMALAGPVLPDALRATGLALVQTGQALAYLVSSVLFGLAWAAWGPTAAVLMAALVAVVAGGVTAGLLFHKGRLA
ncbi:Major Facilitator Superfamily protein [Asanoa ishikariensis]|uniref:Major Facilitator Superfamily protein n=1 Tax=Asanoa ishikariensis TaxID=137265 RepID=A0A1H3TSD4_9ACTN|nr:MFS transporter [Asanoa ishikariensis]SDZ52838.1 Major Facilitator Superfamily protein [Asanoa ishikariensis]